MIKKLKRQMLCSYILRLYLILMLALTLNPGFMVNLNASDDQPLTETESDERDSDDDSNVLKKRHSTPQDYLNATKAQERIIVIGSGHNSGYDYPKNYYLVDISEKIVPDLILDITELASIPHEFVSQFDVVIWENVDIFHFPKENTLRNLYDLLKPGGRLITSPMIQVFNNIKPVEGVDILELKDDVFYYPIEEAPIPFLFFSENLLPESEKDRIFLLAFDEVFKPFLEEHKFRDVKYVPYTAYWKAGKHEEYFQARK